MKPNPEVEFAELVDRGSDLDVKYWLSRQPDKEEKKRWVNYANIYGTPCILLARSLDLCQMLLGADANPNAQDMRGNTALHKACEYGKVERIRLLLECKANPEICNDDDELPLLWAIANDRIEAASLLISLSQNIPKQATTLANRRGYDEMLKLLVTSKAELSISNSSGDEEPLFEGSRGLIQAARKGNTTRMIELLEDSGGVGCDPNSSYCGDRALVIAAQQGHLATVELLLSMDADVNVSDSMGETALFKAILSNKVEIVQILLESKANTEKENVAGQTPLTIARDWGFHLPTVENDG